MKYNKKVYSEARMVAVKAHAGQPYDEIFPYEKHLDDVVKIIEMFGYSGKYIVAGYLHDVIEDGTVSYNDIKNYFGIEVAEMVYCVTDELGRNRKERKAKTLPKTKSNPDAIIVKLADRIANIQHGGKIGMYAKEFKQFKEELYIDDNCDDMWAYLEGILFSKEVEKV
jgi:(p)ppGpp synthase/HD superfamily hydrolase